MASIYSLVPDIQQLIRDKDKGWFTDELSQELSKDIATRLRVQLGGEARKPGLRLSRMGPSCPCALWYGVHHPDLAESLPPWAEVKYSFGHIIEALALTLARASGHRVEGEQDALELDGIVGHRDCVIDGCTVDVKSASSIGFKKFQAADYSGSDSFGYLDQLDGYTLAASRDPIVVAKDRAYILAIDKTLGHMHLYEHHIRPERIRARIEEYKIIIGRSNPPICTCPTRASGSSGNVELAFPATYNAYKYCCKPLLRTFIYSDGPRYLTKVVRTPDVREVDRNGRTIH